MSGWKRLVVFRLFMIALALVFSVSYFYKGNIVLGLLFAFVGFVIATQAYKYYRNHTHCPHCGKPPASFIVLDTETSAGILGDYAQEAKCPEGHIWKLLKGWSL